MIHCTIDIKSGKAEPWSRLQTAAYTIMEESPELEFDEELHVYRFHGKILPSVTGILKSEGFIDTSFYDEWSRTRGSFVHKATYLDDQDQLDEASLDPVILPYVEAWRNFRYQSGFTPIISERPMVCPSLLYCGKPDVIGMFPTGTILRGVVELRNDGTYKLIPHQDHADIDIWRSVVAVHNWKKNMRGGK